ncbi:MAG TPA: catalase [Acetobacteraceae bacterium]|nr:catalase [Acetobacteraceae bacterium]
MSTSNVFTSATGSPAAETANITTAGPSGPALLQNIWPIEKIAHFDREVRLRYRNGLVNVHRVNRLLG